MAHIGRPPQADQLLCLPSHEARWASLAECAAEVIDHHEERRGVTVRLLERGPTARRELVSHRVRCRPWAGTRPLPRHAAASETAAHLRPLEERGLGSRNDSSEPPRWVSVAGAHLPE